MALHTVRGPTVQTRKAPEPVTAERAYRTGQSWMKRAFQEEWTTDVKAQESSLQLEMVRSGQQIRRLQSV